MRTVVQKPKATHRTKPTKSAAPSRARFLPGGEASAGQQVRRAIGNQATRRLEDAKSGNPGEHSNVAQKTHGAAGVGRRSPPAKKSAAAHKLTISKPTDHGEKEADRVADQIMRAEKPPQRVNHGDGGTLANGAGRSGRISNTLQTKRTANRTGTSAASPIVKEVLRSSGQPLDASVRASFEPRLGLDLGHVRVHTDARAAKVSQALGAEAFTYGSDIYFNQSRFAPGHDDGKRLLAHELAHVSQQGRDGSPNLLQRRLLLTGGAAEISDFIAMSETASGLILAHDPITNEVTAVGSTVAPATSATFAAELTRIMADPVQDAEINVGTDQPGVDIGAFPVPRDLTGGGVQNVDMDDINAFEAGAPGIGVADLLHEIVENYVAHATAPVAGVDLFPAAHDAGLNAEAGVATDIVGSGRRVAQASDQIGSNIVRIAEDYDAYYVLSDLTVTAATRSFARSNVSFAPKVAVSASTIDSFISASDVVPGAGAATVTAVVADLTANPLATVRIEGFTDSAGRRANNLDLGRRRAVNAARALVGAGVDGGRIELVPRGETGFVAPNNNDANRALNRRVVFTVTRPGP